MKISIILKSAIMIFLVLFSVLTLTSCGKKSLSADEFPLIIDLDKNSFTVGEKISFTATIINKSGKDVNIATNGKMPCAFFHLASDKITHSETAVRVEQTLKANEEIKRTFEYTLNEEGDYILDVHYRIEVNDISIEKNLDNINIEVR